MEAGRSRGVDEKYHQALCNKGFTINETQSPPNKSMCTGPKQSSARAFGRLVWSMMLSTLQIPEKQASSTIETSSSSSTFRLSSSTTACICFVKSSFVLNSLSNLNSFSSLFCF